MERITASDVADCLVIRLDGEIVMEVVQDVKGAIDTMASASAQPHVVVDLTAVTFMDSSGIGFLIGLKKRIADIGKDFHLYNPPPAIKKLLGMLRLTDYFGMLDRENDLCALSTN